MIRTITTEDLPRLREIHAKYFQHEFTFDDFCQSWIFSFVITDDYDKIITAGAIRPLAEMVAITDYSTSARLRVAALYDMLQITQFVLQNTNFKQVHAFVQDEKWLNQLKRSGFRACAGTPVYMNLE